jgi:hypothetical protein
MGGRCRIPQNPIDSMNATVRGIVKRRLLVAAAAIPVSWGIFQANALSANVTASWTYDYRPEPACSAMRITNCIDHFEVEDITNQQKIRFIQSAGNPSRAIGKVDHISVSFKYGPPFGQRTISVIAVGRDPSGNRITSDPFAARVTLTIRPGAKISLLF